MSRRGQKHDLKKKHSFCEPSKRDFWFVVVSPSLKIIEDLLFKAIFCEVLSTPSPLPPERRIYESTLVRQTKNAPYQALSKHFTDQSNDAIASLLSFKPINGTEA